MEKYRKAYFEIEKALKLHCFPVIILLGLRKTGKTTILKQLAQNHNGFYHDFRSDILTYEETEDLFNHEESLLLFDEVGYLDSFDLFMGSLVEKCTNFHKKVIITSSSYGALKQLGSEDLGGGRSYKVELFPLSFEEYLHFSRNSFNYGDNYDPSSQDIEDFYRLKGVPEGMDFVIDRQYMFDIFRDIDAARGNLYHNERDIVLTPIQYTSILDIIAYTLNDNISMKRLSKNALYGSQEFLSTKGLSLSQSLIGLASKIVNNMARNIQDDIGIEDISHIVAYLYHSGFLFIDLHVGNGDRRASSSILNKLLLLKTYDSFVEFFKMYDFSVISPLLYTRILVDLEDIAGELYTNVSLRGRLYELAVKSESVYAKGYDLYHDSRKYKVGVTEIDLYDRGLLFEAAVGSKDNDEFSVDKVLEEHELIRVVTDIPGTWKFNEIFYKIGYPKALLMISNKTIRNLEPRKVINNNNSVDIY